MSKTIFLTGIGTDVGKTVVSAILTETLQADYWKPIQCGDITNSDTLKVQSLVINKKSQFHPEYILLQTAESPHYAAKIEHKIIQANQIIRPKTNNYLIIEGAGGLLVPLNKNETIADLIFKDDYVIVVSKHYLGSINHTLLTINQLLNFGYNKIGIIFIGDKKKSSEKVLEQFPVFIIGRIPIMKEINPKAIKEESLKIGENLTAFLLLK